MCNDNNLVEIKRKQKQKYLEKELKSFFGRMREKEQAEKEFTKEDKKESNSKLSKFG
ncbi:hypothetical protein [Salipaludibacillus daqingensis]|uniref:hypothetical protein n=1 Tax=Salipaludibacillus daqingensis TaxID=3041001 RepID=UPI002474601D|nr:hypothetical protein [Salipaludibacillus daqingensis]